MTTEMPCVPAHRSKGDSFVTKENSDGPLGVTGDERGDQFTELEIDEFLITRSHEIDKLLQKPSKQIL